MAKNALTGRYEDICIDKSADCGIIIPGLEIIEAGFVVVDVAAVAEGIIYTQRVCHTTAGGKDITPSVVCVANYFCAFIIQNGKDIAKGVGHIIVVIIIILYCHRVTVGTVNKGQGIAAYLHLMEIIAVIKVGIGGTAIGTLCSHAGCVVGVGSGICYYYYTVILKF